MKKIVSIFFSINILLFTFLLIFNPKICVNSAVSSIILCGRVIIPSLFPFTFCVMFIMKSKLLNSIKILDKPSRVIFGLDSKFLGIFLLSLIGGYPLGAKMLNQANADKKMRKTMLNYSVNAGPAFIISAIGNGVFSSQKIGVLLFFSHIIPPFFLAILSKGKQKNKISKKESTSISLVDNFVLSASESANTLISICSFIILFSVITGYINFYSDKLTFLKYLSPFLEVTNAVSKTHNIFLISFLLGFGGICVWFQVFSLCKNFKVDYISFILNRILHGGLSAGITFLLIKCFKITIPTMSNSQFFTPSPFYTSDVVGIALIIMGIVFMISLSSKNFAGNILHDIV